MPRAGGGQEKIKINENVDFIIWSGLIHVIDCYRRKNGPKDQVTVALLYMQICTYKIKSKCMSQQLY